MRPADANEEPLGGLIVREQIEEFLQTDSLAPVLAGSLANG